MLGVLDSTGPVTRVEVGYLGLGSVVVLDSTGPVNRVG